MRQSWRLVDVDNEPVGSPVPIFCIECQDTGIVLGESVFVNNGHGYGVEYLGAPCPRCSTEDDA